MKAIIKACLLINPQGLQALKDAICEEQWIWAFHWSAIWDVVLCLHICTSMMFPFSCLLNLKPGSIHCHFYIKVGPIKSSLQKKGWKWSSWSKCVHFCPTAKWISCCCCVLIESCLTLHIHISPLSETSVPSWSPQNILVAFPLLYSRFSLVI